MYTSKNPVPFNKENMQWKSHKTEVYGANVTALDRRYTAQYIKLQANSQTFNLFNRIPNKQMWLASTHCSDLCQEQFSSLIFQTWGGAVHLPIIIWSNSTVKVE